MFVLDLFALFDDDITLAVEDIDRSSLLDDLLLALVVAEKLVKDAVFVEDLFGYVKSADNIFRYLSGLPLVPAFGRWTFWLSKSASTASWSIRLSFLIITSGAPRSISFLRRLFLVMTFL